LTIIIYLQVTGIGLYLIVVRRKAIAMAADDALIFINNVSFV